MELRIEELTRRLKAGNDLSISKNHHGIRRLTIQRKMSGSNLYYQLSENEYLDLMEDLVTWLAEQHHTGVAVDIILDYHGARWIELQAGFLNLRRSRLGLSQQFIDLLPRKIAQTALAHQLEATVA